MDVPAVLAADPDVLEKVLAHLARRAATGTPRRYQPRLRKPMWRPESVPRRPESTTIEESRAKAALGIFVQVREGSTGLEPRCIAPAARAAGDIDETGAWSPTTSFQTT